MTEIKIAITDNEIASCWEAISVLRPMLKRENFVSQIQDLQKEGYHLLYIQEKDKKTVAIAGYRIYTMLYCGKMLYLDDLSTLEEYRGKGYASQLLNHLKAIALENNCVSIQLDSGPTRTTAHKLYFKEDFTISAYHFHKKIE
ncbi:GNAT family N-acetyltransferase [Flavobacterium sp. L1I52]|uniref:GNAT family N-acetyltransferase n=1 Tax=Flavobacterium pokkalii TaxID=1940408 RepID=A0ABR7UMF5_9FLAO|nr:GNAT family N-acetyltransferase [Flavobacterium pokkalii]MBD0723606.1 GNAT family N-acetyltransferase [Flavobacterium pokkalii]